jgi:surfactin synthase thioesterase subunit
VSADVAGGCLVVSFPAAGVGDSMAGWLTGPAAEHPGAVYLPLPNPGCLDELTSDDWRQETLSQIQHAVVDSAADRVVLVGHCLGGLSALYLVDEVRSRCAVPTALVVVNTPCPDGEGRVPSLVDSTDQEIGKLLAADGFPTEVLEDEDMLTEVADRVRDGAQLGDWIAQRLHMAGTMSALTVLSTRGDAFIGVECCADWRTRVLGEFNLTIVDGRHTLDDASMGVLARLLDSAINSP